MRFAVIADVFGNWEALRCILGDAARLGIGPREVVCLGNLVGPCGGSLRCLAAGQTFGLMLRGECENLLFTDGTRAMRHADALSRLLPDPYATQQDLWERIPARDIAWLRECDWRAAMGRFEFIGDLPEARRRMAPPPPNPFEDAPPSRFYLQPQNLAVMDVDGQLVTTPSGWIDAPHNLSPHGIEMTASGIQSAGKGWQELAVSQVSDWEATGEIAYTVGVLPGSAWRGQHWPSDRPVPCAYLVVDGRYLFARHLEAPPPQPFLADGDAEDTAHSDSTPWLTELTPATDFPTLIGSHTHVVCLVVPADLRREMAAGLAQDLAPDYPEVHIVLADASVWQTCDVGDELRTPKDEAMAFGFRDRIEAGRCVLEWSPTERPPDGTARERLRFLFDLVRGRFPQMETRWQRPRRKPRQ